MLGGGSLTIRAANISLGADDLGQIFAVDPGDYVMVEVADSGTGLSEDALGHAFEPFFTPRASARAAGAGSPWSMDLPSNQVATSLSPTMTERAPRSPQAARHDDGPRPRPARKLS
jgi:hypothetical protein